MDSAKESLLEAKKFETSIDNIKAQILTAEKGNADREAKLKKFKSINKKLKDLERKGWSRIVDIEDAGNELVKNLERRVFPDTTEVGFEKAYDSVQWDYLDDVLKKFGFGERWCGWIQGCLKSSRGSVIVNGSMFKGISLGSSLQLSHMFYADDAVFVGQWSDSNIDIIVHVLDCFYRASGLRINMSKSKLMGVYVDDDKVEKAALKLGCATLKIPFSYLGSKVGGLMSRIQSWNETVDRVVARLSKWKMKTLSIGGRLTLLKSVLGSMPIYHMSIFKVPMKVLHHISVVNIARRVIKAIHGVDGKIGKNIKSMYSSVCLDIVHEAEKLKVHGIDLVSCIHKRLGNGANTSFWEDIWRGDVEFKKFLDSSFRRAPRGHVEQLQLAAMLVNLEGVSLVNMRDRWRWSLEGSREFSVASVRKLIDDKTLPEVSVKSRWVKVVPIKVNIHAWKVRLDCLPTRLNISRRCLDIDSILCPLCENALESTRHIFFTCHIAREIFCKVSCWWNVSFTEVSTYEEWLDWILNIRLSIKYKKLLEGVCYIMWWHIWSFRNKSIFGFKIPANAVIFEDVVSRSFYWCRSRCKASFSWIDWCKIPYLVTL
ncbi:RNA-directed DNA polymerase, eukaryota, reverse transcriptase zinc-binding domain protein [Tanacetum coccineum]|uniref:RNA-directed DNA polymerase, eukaryota, reverse transcriptase zinc-binding domain protein n=1 Tax=Tanacetum coccineum TaxID=301880 RepID=A0ABQ5E926_9ASTR